MSAQVNLAGLFPPAPDQIWNQVLAWQPIPIHSVPIKRDAILAVDKPCDRFTYLMVEFEKTAAYKELLDRNRTLIRYLEENSGQKLPTINSILVLRDTLLLEQDRGFWYVN